MRKPGFGLGLNRNHYFIFGFLLGLVLSFYIPENVWDLVQSECPQLALENNLIEKFGEDFEPHLNLINKPLAAKKPIKNVVRPRYYSSELGIREKLFIGVMTSQDNINTLATAINQTATHLVNKIKFFINAENVKTTFKLKNIVGFTDTRENLRPFHIIKYIADNYLDDYDYFLLIPDTAYVDARKLKALTYHLSIAFEIYMGQRLSGNPLSESEETQSDRNYCDFNSGILFSSSVIRKMKANLDWCVRNGVTNTHSVNIGRCVKFASHVAACQDSFQGVRLNSFKLNDNVKLFKDLSSLSKNKTFHNSAIIHPLTNVDDFYRLHVYFSKNHLNDLREKNRKLEHDTYKIANGSISNNILEIRWPLGVPEQGVAETRYDINVWQHLNKTHMFIPNAESAVEPLSRIDSMDFQKVLEVAISYARSKYPKIYYESIHTAYRRFDPTRGMDYLLHLNFRAKSQDTILKSFEIVKPLGRVEVVPSPYVTESTRIAVLLPVFEDQISTGMEFVRLYEKICMKNQDNTFLMIIFMYRMNSESKGDKDPFRDIKQLALNLSTKFKNDGSRIAWVSTRLPASFSGSSTTEDVMLSSIYSTNGILSIAAADLALPKIGLETLVLMASNSMTFKADFLNRVRMNTIQGYQIFSPIGFLMYPCKFAGFCKECESCDVSQSTGYFDRTNYDVVSFYSRDYVQARKKIEELIPIIRDDNDIELLVNRKDTEINNIVDMFVASFAPVHILRGVEPHLRLGQRIKQFFDQSPTPEVPKCSSSFKSCISLAARKQIGDAILRYQDLKNN